jgi:hypothetical protein
MTDKTKVIPTDVYIDGQLERIEFHNLEGQFVVQSVWDWELDKVQDSENRAAFRKWSYRMIEQLDSGAFQVMT